MTEYEKQGYPHSVTGNGGSGGHRQMPSQNSCWGSSHGTMPTAVGGGHGQMPSHSSAETGTHGNGGRLGQMPDQNSCWDSSASRDRKGGGCGPMPSENSSWGSSWESRDGGNRQRSQSSRQQTWDVRATLGLFRVIKLDQLVAQKVLFVF